ncbi:MAG: ketoacyl-ACP synthase III [Candidatus Marinimicrobia bacterium]|nr:ketoacyl-ACP synthase III [Candidatus Neomarinimicrobiota bacterium]
MSVLQKSAIAGIGFHVPERIITNSDLTQWMETSDEWITDRSGIKERRWIDHDGGASSLAIQAAKNAMEDAHVLPEEIDMVICATITSDYFFPGISAQVQEALGLNHVGAFDIKAACPAFVYALSVGDQYIKTGHSKTVLVIGAEVQSTALDISTRGRDTAVLFGDGAGAAILKPSDNESAILSTHLHTEGKYLKSLWCEGPASKFNPRISKEMLEEGRQYPYMNGREVFKNAVKRFPQVIQEAMDANELTMDDVAQIIPHQANLRISQAVAKRMKIGMDKVYSNIHKYGNTTAASIPIALTEARNEGKFQRGDYIILAAFGAGFRWASAAIRW